VKEQYGDVQDKYLKDLREVEAKLQKARQRTELVENRRATETAAFQSDVHTLKKKVGEFERYIKKLKELVDAERIDGLKGELQEPVEVGGLLEELGKVEIEVKEAKKFN